MMMRILRYGCVFVLGGVCLFGAGIFFAAAEEDATSEVLTNSLDNFDSAFQELKDERDALREEIESMKTEQSSMIDDVRSSIDESREEKDTARENLPVARTQVFAASGENEPLADRAAAKDADANRAIEALVVKDDAYKDDTYEDMVKENERLKKQLIVGEQTYAKAADRISTIEADKEGLERELEALRENHRKTLFGREDELVRLKLEKDSLTQQLALAQKKVEKDAMILADAEQALRENAVLRQKAEETRRSLDDQMATNAKLNAERETLLRQIDQIREDHKRFVFGQNELVTKAKLDRDALAQQMALAVERERVATERATESDRRALKTEKEGLSEVYRLRADNKTLKDQAVSLGAKIMDFQRDREDIHKKAQEEFTRALTDARDQLKVAQEKIKSFEASETALIAARDRLAVLEKERDGFLKKIDLLSGQLVDLNAALAKNTSLEKENKLLKAGLDNTTRELSELGQEHKGAIERFEKERSDMEAARKEYEENLSKIEEAKGLVGQNASLLERTKTAEAKLKKLLDQMIATQDENEKLKSDSKTRINPGEFKDTMNRNKVLLEENANFRDQLAGLMKERDEIKAAYDALADENKDLKAKIARMEGSLKTWDDEKQQWDRAERDTRSALEGKNQKLGEVSDEIRKIISENKGLKVQIESFPSKLAILNARVQGLLKENAMLHYNLGVIYTERQAYPEAIREFEKALENRSDDAYAHYNLGIIYSQYEINEAKAVEHFSKYLKFAPKDDKDANMARKYLFTRESYELEKHP